MTFLEKYNQRVDQTSGLLSVGLDSDLAQIPQRFFDTKYPQFEFNKWIIQQTYKYASTYKLNTAFYEARGTAGWSELTMTMEYLRERHPDIPTIADAKRADIGSTNEQYAQAIFSELGFDAITLHAYVGKEALAPFLAYADKGCIFLCKTSNPGSGEFQDLEVGASKQPLWQVVAQHIASDWNEQGNCLLVVGATYPEHMAQVRKLVGEMTLLVPGVGAQGGELAKVLKVGLNKDSKGLIINSSRGIIFAEDPQGEAKKLVEEMRQILKK
jgi:orotidine-5'-phosphate decarboxylase